jgi:biotin transport system substrate-specific component
MVTRSDSLAVSYRPGSGATARGVDVALVAGGAALTALSAQAAITLPFTPVPITGQTFAVLLTAAALGSTRGVAAQLLYLAVGMAGVPVFAGGAGGVGVVARATGGYLVGFVLAALVVGWLSERGWDRRAVSSVGQMVVGNLVIYAVGLPWLYVAVGTELCTHPFFGQYVPQVVCSNGLLVTLYAGLFPFLLGDALKLLLASAVLPSTWRLIRVRNSLP